jgi:dihydroorotase-like cyclic amidohydrolase
MYDLIVRGGQVLLDSGELVDCEVGVTGGIISAIGVELGNATRVIDARGLTVLPGAVDPHVHFGNTMDFADELAIDSGSALLGGVTTIGCFLRSTEPYSPTLGALISTVDERSSVDVFFHLQMFGDPQIDDMSVCAEEFGITSFKFYLSGIPGIVGSVDEAMLLRGMSEAHRVSADAVVAVHCENESLIAWAASVAKSLEQLRTPEAPLVAWERHHPALAEAVAIDTAAALAHEAGVRLYVVHVSSAQGMQRVRELQARGLDVVGETTSAYLALQSDDPNELLVKMVPPIRDGENRLALWNGVRDGTIQTIGTDNTARTRESKNPTGGVYGAKPGYPMLGTHVAATLHTGLREQDLPLAEVWRCMSRAPAEVFGLYPRKGAILPGADADLVLVDLNLTRVVRPSELGSFSDFSPLEGKSLTGWPVVTIKGGVVVAENGRLTTSPSGRYLPRRTAGSVG